MQLIKPFIRSRNINGMPRMTLERMERVLGGKIQVAPQTNGKRKQYPYPHTMKGEGASSMKKEAASRGSPIYRRRRKTVIHVG